MRKYLKQSIAQKIQKTDDPAAYLKLPDTAAFYEDQAFTSLTTGTKP